MKLRELSEIIIGIQIPKQDLVSIPKDKDSIAVITKDSFEIGESGNYTEKIVYYYLSEKKVKKRDNELSKNTYLKYGDYLLYTSTNLPHLYKNNNTSQRTIASSDFILIRPSLGILSDFLGYPKNREYFYNEYLNKCLHSVDVIEKLGEIEIFVDNIKELEEKKKEWSLMEPLDESMLPFNILQKTMTVDLLFKRYTRKEILLETDFQRLPNLWDLDTKSRLIESLMLRLPIPAFFFDGSDPDNWIIIDGLQRISAISGYLQGDFSLVGLDYLKRLNGKKYEEIDRKYQRNLEDYEIFIYVIQKGTPLEVKYRMFKNINTGSLRLERQEIRHALNPGNGSLWLKSVTNQSWFKTMVPLGERDQLRMEDRELVLRFAALLRNGYEDYKPHFPDFLDSFMAKLNDYPEIKLKTIESDLKNVLELIFRIFKNEPPFSRSVLGNKKSYSHNNVLFELLTWSLEKLDKKQKEFIEKNHQSVKEKITEYFKSKPDDFFENENAYSKKGLQNRFEEMEKFIINITK